jgi:hypothetical protein
MAVEHMKQALSGGFPPDATWFIGTAEGCVMVCCEGTFFVDSNGDVMGPADPKLVDDALISAGEQNKPGT